MNQNNIKKFINHIGGTVNEAAILPDGSGFATASFPLPADHWLYFENEHKYEAPPMGMRCGTNHPRYFEMKKMIYEAARYAVKRATMNGKCMDFDPDALVQNMVTGLIGYHTPEGLSQDDWANPDPVPSFLLPIWCGWSIDDKGDLTLSEVYNGVGIKTDQGLIGIAQRDSGIEVVLETKDGCLFWSSTNEWGNNPQENDG